MKGLLLCVLMPILFLSCDQENDKEQIYALTKAANDASLKGHLEKNAGKITAVYTNDAVILPPGRIKPVVGIDSIRSYYEKGFAGTGSIVVIKTENIRYDVVDENNATELGSYVIQYKDSGSSNIKEFKGEMLIVWKKVNGEWKIYLDMWH